MKKAYSCLLAALVLGAGFGSFWLVQASRFEKRLLQHISQAVEGSSFNMKFHCDSITKSGFPFHIRLKLQNPKIEIMRPALDDRAAAQHIADCRLEGTVADTFSLLGHLRKVEADGHAILTLSEGGCFPAAEWNAKGSVEMDLGASSHLESISGLFSNKIQEITSCTISCRDTKLTNLQPTSDLESIEIKKGVVSYEKKGGQNHFHFASDVTVEHNLSMNIPDLVGDIRLLADSVNNELKKHFYKTDYSVDFALEMPLFETLKKIRDQASLLMSERIPRFAVDIKKMDTANQFGSSHLAAGISVEEDDKKNVRASGSIESNAQYTEECEKTIYQVIDAVHTAMPQLQMKEKELQNLFQNHAEAVKAIVPKLSTFGPISFGKNWKMEMNKENFSAQFQLEKLALLSALYGARLNATLNHSMGAFKGQSTAEFISYKSLVHDMADYYNRMTILLNYMRVQETPEYKKISKELQNKFLAYLRAISNDPKGGSDILAITFGNMQEGGKIGTMSLAEFVTYSTQVFKEIGEELFPTPQGAEKDLRSPAPATPSVR